MEMGKPKYGNSGGSKNYRSLKEGSNVYRVLPPMGSLAEAGKWFFYWAIHFGYRGTDGKQRPIPCVQKKNRNGLIEVRCPACERWDEAKQELETQREAGVSEEALKPLTERSRNLQPDKKYYMNALTPDGSAVVLKIPYKSKQALDAVISQLEDDSVDPIDSDGGVWLDFHRTGYGRNTVHSVKVVLEKIALLDGRIVRDIKHAPLTSDQISFLTGDNTSVADLPKIYKRLTADEMGMVVNGDETAMDRIFGLSETQTEQTQTAQTQTATAPVAAAAPAVAQAPVAAPAAPAAPVAQAPVVPVEVPITTPPTLTKAEASNLSEDELMNLFNK